MAGTKIIYLKDVPGIVGYEPGDLGTMVPVVIMEGQRMGLFSKVSIVNGSDGLQRPVLKLERIMYGADDEVLTMTTDEDEAWCVKNGVK